MRDLSRLLRPKSIAIIGGGTWCENVITMCQQMGFDGAIYPVHPTKDKILNLATHNALSKLPEVPDATFIGVNRHATIEIVRTLSDMNAGGAVCFASGFAEAVAEDETSADLQSALLEAAGDMPILGPNCYGYINYLDGALLWPDQHGGTRVDKGVAIITQSSNIAINLTMQKRALPISYVVTAGNQAQTGLSEIAHALLSDERVTALGLHIEGIDDLDQFVALASFAHQQGKKIVALKIGKSDQAQAATISHTASLAGSDASARALLERLAIAQVDSLSCFLETLKLLHVIGGLSSNKIASMSCSGGEASLIADTAEQYDVNFPPLTDSQKNNLSEALGNMVALSNPLDYHTYIWGDKTAMTKTFTAMLEPHLALGVLILDIPRADRCDPSAWTDVFDSLKDARDATNVPVGVVASLPETMPENLAADLIAKGIVPFCGLDDTLGAIGAVTKNQTPDPNAVFHKPLAQQLQTLSEAQAKAALAEFGLTTPKSYETSNIAELTQHATELGFPVVLKGLGIAHKTEEGAVKVNLQDAEALIAAAKGMPTNSFLMEQMISDNIAELLIGVVHDPAHGYTLTIAAGGILTELLNDSVSLILPTTKQSIISALNELKIAKLLHGYRGMKAADINGIVEAVINLQNYVIANAGAVSEVEINPLICGHSSTIAVDALIKIGEAP